MEDGGIPSRSSPERCLRSDVRCIGDTSTNNDVQAGSSERQKYLYSAAPSYHVHNGKGTCQFPRGQYMFGDRDDGDYNDVELLCTRYPSQQRIGTTTEYSEREQRKAVSPISSRATEFSPPFLSNDRKTNNTAQHTDEDISRSVAKSEIPATPLAPSTCFPNSGLLSSASTIGLPISMFPHRTSAYLQSLAEICHAILWDARWRVEGPRRSRLFSWEQADDMSAIHTLSRRYHAIDGNEQSYVGNHVGEESQEFSFKSSDSGENDRKKANTENVKIETDTQISNNPIVAKNSKFQFHSEGGNSDPDDRCLEVYARLYFRKGPWFRLDNIYASYYLPKKPRLQEEKGAMSCNVSKQVDTSAIDVPATVEFPKPYRPSNFFAQRNNEHRNCEKKQTTVIDENDYIDKKCVDLQMEAVALLLEDIKRLFHMGLIRSFHSEEECGRTVGKREGKASLLREDERRAILTKLGGGRKQCAYNKSRTNYFPSSTKSTEEQQRQPLENLIWKQMCQQQTIFHSFNNRSGSTILPVIKHVHQILVEKWASSIILKASKVEFVPSPILRSATKTICNALLKMLQKFKSEMRLTSTVLCVRLREAPVRTLRRACRLYLCATSGPGDMRNNGSNAWRSLPDSHSKDLQKLPLRTNLVSPPGSSWNTVCYPGKDWRLRVISCSFVRAYRPLVVKELDHTTGHDRDGTVMEGDENGNNLTKKAKELGFADNISQLADIQVFRDIQDFHQWELGVEVRENCDFLLELNDLLLYNERKRAREARSESKSNSSSDGESHDGDFEVSEDSSTETSDTPRETTELDFQELLTIVGRAKIIQGFLQVQKEDSGSIFSEIEREVSILLGIPLCERPLCTLIVQPPEDAGMSQIVETSRLANECERILGVIGIVLTHVLEHRNIHKNTEETRLCFERPWLRHMNWEGCMSYVLWDIIPLLERRGYYGLAINALEVILFGKRLSRAKNEIIPDISSYSYKSMSDVTGYSHHSIISRRARGKAFDRLIIDYTHLVRKKVSGLMKLKSVSKDKGSTKPKRRASAASIVNEVVTLLTEHIIRTSVPTGQIAFSSIRTLARRLKRPLSSTLKGLLSFETSELGLRLSNGTIAQQAVEKYNDWSPTFDTAVANAIGTDRASAGGRCSFIGFENDDHAVRTGSLNVEELAKEYYHQGRLPLSDDSQRNGGWYGYHDEGGKIRILFRILSSATLGMDWESTKSIDPASVPPTVHLTPYQGAPFDLHVGAERTDPAESRFGGIYAARKNSINDFLGRLSNLDGEDLSDFVYDCLNKRVQYVNSLHRRDPSLESDLQQARTLAMVAAGLGGKVLSSAFRCLFFDYRHYSGGLPDLLLVRAFRYNSTADDRSTRNDNFIGELVDLGEWIGEEFSSKYQEAMKAKQVARIFADTDGDFLGCSKVGDSGGRATFKFQRSSRSRNSSRPNGFFVQEEDHSNENEAKPFYSMPEKLSFRHELQPIRVECMFVEVKSQNDRLDARQEDWLNILDLHGNARVCKFVKASKAKDDS